MYELPPVPDLKNASFMQRFRIGLRYPLHGFRLLRAHHELWHLVALPVLISVSVLTGAAWFAWWAVPSVINLIWVPGAEAATWVIVIFNFLKILMSFSLTLVALIGWYFGAGIMVIPFNDKLGERVETLVDGPYEEPFSFRVLAGDLGLSVSHSILGFILYAITMIALFTLNLIPAIGSIASTVLSFLATAFFISRETMDGALSRRRLSFLHKLRIVRKNLAVALGFGMVTAMMLWIPLLNFLTLPIAVVGGTLLYLHLEAQGLVPAASGKEPFVNPRKRSAADDVPARIGVDALADLATVSERERSRVE